MAFRLTIDNIAAPKFKQNLAGLHDRMEAALSGAVNMAASMIKTRADEDISSAGNFGERWTSGLHVDAETTLGNMRISMYSDIPYFGIFEDGGTIKGNPLLWIPLSFSDAVGIQAKDYPGGLFTVARKSGGPPLLFSKEDRQPKYFGISQVVIPKKFHVVEIEHDVMSNFRAIFAEAFKSA